MKCTLTYAKEQKIMAMQKENYLLEEELNKLLAKHDSLIK